MKQEDEIGVGNLSCLVTKGWRQQDTTANTVDERMPGPWDETLIVMEEATNGRDEREIERGKEGGRERGSSMVQERVTETVTKGTGMAE
jgi:hypothetical protein